MKNAVAVGVVVFLSMVGQLVAALGVDGLAEVLIETLSDADIERLIERLNNRCREEC